MKKILIVVTLAVGLLAGPAAAGCPVPEPEKFLGMLAAGADECGFRMSSTKATVMALECGVSPSVLMNPEPLGLDAAGREVMCPQIFETLAELGL